MAADVRVRFAPAPTGSLHVGSARTALFNWLFARHHGGTFILRIEDTDRERSRPEWVHAIQDALGWLGLAWDEGPYLQGDQLDRYRDAAETLVGSGHAYASWATEEELDAEREAARSEGRPPRFAEVAERVAAGRTADSLHSERRRRSVWFRTPDEGTSSFDDLVRGRISVEWDTISDFAIVRSSGSPVFYLANAVDDADMAITHVIRGEDLLDSTHRVLAIREALGVAGRPVYAHLPLLVGADRAKLSKRHGAISLEEFAQRGYLPEALINYLALLGFPAEDGREIRPIEEVAAEFDLPRVHHGAAFFDYDKLDWMNGQYLRHLPVAEFADRLGRFAEERYGSAIDKGVVVAAAPLAQTRSVTLVDAAASLGFLVATDPIDYDPPSWDRLVAVEGAEHLLAAAEAHLSTCEWTVEAIDLRGVVNGLGMKPGKVMHVLYTAIEGEQRGLPLFEAILLLGRERAIGRLRAARNRLAGSS